MARTLWHILISILIIIINLSFYGLSHSDEPIAGYVTIVKVRMESSTKRQSIEKVIIQSGIYKEKPPKAYDTTSIAPSGLPQLVLLDPQGRVLYMTEFEYPKLMTVPPLPPGERDVAPSVVPIENPEVTLVLPYFPDALTIQVIAPGENRPSDSMPLSDAEFIKKNKSDSVPIEPVPSLPGSFNILIMASGYNTSIMTNFQTRANSLKQTVQNTEPFKSYASKININIYGNTADLGCYTGCYSIDRLMCCDSSKVISAAASSGYYYDEIIVIHNTATYAGGGYRDLITYKTNSYSTYCMMYDGPYTTPMGLHEFGHSFGDLCDEYAYTSEGYSYYDCVNCRANCSDWSLYSSSCQLGCDAKQTYYRPENSVMLSLSYTTYNTPSIKAPYSPDGLEKRIQYFTGTVPQWESFPGKTISSPALAWNPVANKLQMVVRAANDSIWTATFNSSGIFNNDWMSVPGGTSSSPALAWNSSANKFQIVVRASNDSIWTATFNSSGVFNNDWAPIPGATPSAPALVWNSSANKLQIVVRASYDSIWAATFNSSGAFNNDWAPIPGATSSAPALAWNPVANELQIVVRASNDSIWAATFNSSGAFNNDWAPIPGATPSAPALAWDASTSQLCLLVRGSNDSIWFSTFNSSGSFNNDWVNIPGGAASSPGMAYLPSIGYLGIVVRGSDDSLWELLY